MRDISNARPTIRGAEHALREAGFSKRQAKAILSVGWKAIEGNDKPRWLQVFVKRGISK